MSREASVMRGRRQLGARCKSVEMKSPKRYRVGRRRSRRGWLSWAESSSSCSRERTRASVRSESAGKESSQLTTQVPRDKALLTQSSRSSSSSSPGTASCLERPSGPLCLSVGTCTSLKSKSKIAAIQ